MKKKSLLSIAIITTSLMAGSLSAMAADTTSTPKPAATKTTNPATAKYQADLAAYKIALQQYRVDLVKIEIAYRPALKAYWAAWISTNQTFNAAWQATWSAFKTANEAYQAKLKPLTATRDASIGAADSAFLAAIAANSSPAAIDLALKAHSDATGAAQNAFKTAVSALGAEPVRPVKPADPVKPAPPTKPTPPVKPVAPNKPGVVAKASPTKNN